MANTFKKSLITLLHSHLTKKNRLLVHWKCVHCRKEHEANLFQDAASLETDVLTGTWKADIGLFNDLNQLIAAIHISKNKRPITEVTAFYQKQNIIYLQLMPGDDSAPSMQHPFFVNACLIPKCETCNSFQCEKNLFIIDSSCWKCANPMKVAVVDCGSQCLGPDKFTEGEITLAREKGTFIQTNYSSVVRDSYLSNTCPSCQKLTGNHYLFEHLEDAKYGHSKFERIPIGYFCDACNRNKANNVES
jgi:hypothetical protein